MFRIVHSQSLDVADTADFVETINRLDQDPRAKLRNLFDPKSDIVVARAPGRLDVMGGIADYSGSLVLQMPIREATFAALQLDPARVLTIVSLSEANDREPVFEIPLADFEVDGRPVDYETARRRIECDSSRRWAAYVAGAFLVLMRERQVRFNHGARILISSRVPEGKGVSSSAALEVAAMQAVVAAFELEIAPRDMALLCQKVENLVVGAPCGVMDQMTAVCGEEARLLALLCQPAEVKGSMAIPDDLAIWGLDSGERHSVGGADYGAVRAGAFMGYRMIAEMVGFKVRSRVSNNVEIDDAFWRGYLANLTPTEFEIYASRLPERIGGGDFQARFHGTTDSVAQISPDRSYLVRAPTAHPVYENHRINIFMERFARSSSDLHLESLGELMYQSHASYSACGLASKGTDLLVQLVREAGPARGLYGARITGGGSGGTVAVLARRVAESTVNSVAEKYDAETGYQPYIFSGSSPGCAAFGHLTLRYS